MTSLGPTLNRELLPSAVDPTVFDEAFLRQLERLMLVTRKSVHGGMKGVRRSVKRGQSVEFTDYRNYTLGDDLRALDWNLYARLEKLFIKLFIEEEDVNVHILLDASAFDGWRRAGQDAVRQARRRGAGLRRPGLLRPRLDGRAAGQASRAASRASAAPAASSRCWPISPA